MSFRLTNYCTLEYVYEAELVLSVDGIRKNLRPFSLRHILFLCISNFSDYHFSMTNQECSISFMFIPVNLFWEVLNELPKGNLPSGTLTSEKVM